MHRKSVACLTSIVFLFAASRANATDLNPIGVHIAADGGTEGSSSGEQPELLGPDVTAGVVPMSNWNDFVITRFLNGEDKSNTDLPEPQSIPTSSTPFTLMDSSGAATSAQVTAWTGNNSFSVYGGSETAANPNAQLVNGLLGSINAPDRSRPNYPAVMTISSLPFSAGYDVYVYFNANFKDYQGMISLASGSYTSATYYFSTTGQSYSPTSNPFFIDDSSSTTPGVYPEGNYVEIPVPASGIDGATNQFTITLSAVDSGNADPAHSPGFTAIEIVPIPEPSSLALMIAAASSMIGLATRRRPTA